MSGIILHYKNIKLEVKDIYKKDEKWTKELT